MELNRNYYGIAYYYRGLRDSAIEDIYAVFYHSLIKKDVIPSSVFIEGVDKKFFKLIAESKDFELMAFRDTVDLQTPNSTIEEEPHDFGKYNSPDRVSIFASKKSVYKYPLAIKIVNQNDSLDVWVCSYDIEDVRKFSDKIIKDYPMAMDFKKDVYFGILYKAPEGLLVKRIKLDEKEKPIDLTLNYGKHFPVVHDTIIKKLNNDKRGVFIFHGEAGTGKTTYIKQLAREMGGKRSFIFIPSAQIDSLASPSLLPILLGNKDNVLVLEDAEKAIVARDDQDGYHSLVSTLLNIGDGILGSMLNLSIIVTFNTKKDKVDPALLRKGRLSYEHNFSPLSIEDSQALLDKLNVKHTATEAMTLADIYNFDVDTGHKPIIEDKPRIGF